MRLSCHSASTIETRAKPAPARATVRASMTRGPWRSARAPMPKPARPPSTRLTESAVEMAPRLHPKLSARTGRNTPYAASGVAMPKVIMNRAATISQRRAGGRIRRFLSHRRGLRSGTRARACPRPRVWCITNDGNSKGGENDMAQLRIPLDAQRFAKGLTWKDYMAQMGDTRVRTEDNYAKSGLTDDERKFFGTVTAVRYVLMLAENWCGDVHRNSPLIAHISEAMPNAELRVFFRDQNADLRDAFLNTGYQSIPVGVFFDRDWNEIGRWIERAHAATAKVIGIRAKTLDVAPKDKQDAAMAEYRKLVQVEYDAPGGPLWRAAAQEVRLLLEQQLGLAPKK